jgi:hypothetical protein
MLLPVWHSLCIIPLSINSDKEQTMVGCLFQSVSKRLGMRCRSAVLLTWFVFWMPIASIAQSVPTDPPAGDSSLKSLIDQQRQLADRFTKMEELFLRMSELESTTNPERSGLLLRAAKLSKELATGQRLKSAGELLEKKQLQRALEEQLASAEDLGKLLQLLQSENRQERLKDQRKKYETWIRDIQKLERMERSLRGRSENGQDMKSASRDQGEVADQAEQVARQMESQEGQTAYPSGQERSDTKTEEGNDSKEKPRSESGQDRSAQPNDGRKPDPGPEGGNPQQEARAILRKRRCQVLRKRRSPPMTYRCQESRPSPRRCPLMARRILPANRRRMIQSLRRMEVRGRRATNLKRNRSRGPLSHLLPPVRRTQRSSVWSEPGNE